MVIEKFHGTDAETHDAFQAWRFAHPNGFNLTEKTTGHYVAHWAQDKRENEQGRGCHHQGGSGLTFESGHCLTTAAKVCSDSLAELMDWARVNGAAVKNCAHCNSKKFPFPTLAPATPPDPGTLDAQVGDDGWTTEELRASVEAYVEMQSLHRTGKPFTKKRYYASLAARYGRSEKAFEYRMQNISYVLSLLGRDWLQGLKPAKNVGANVAAEIQSLLAQVEGRRSLPSVAEQVQVRAQMSKPVPRPTGVSIPIVSTASVTQYRRDLAVKAWVLQQAGGVCECCSQPAPFKGADGLPYLEVHHVHQLADGGADTVENTVALCPNCHRELHYGAEAKALVDTMRQSIARLMRR